MSTVPDEFQKDARRAARLWAEEKGVSRRTRRLAAFWAYQEEIFTDAEVKQRKFYLKQQMASEQDDKVRRLHRYHLSFIRWYWRRYCDCDCEYCCSDYTYYLSPEKIEDTDMQRTGLSPQYPI
jgi:hypothetical protein